MEYRAYLYEHNSMKVFYDILPSDERFQAMHLPRQKDWFLKISNIVPEDAGRYICKVPIMPSAINRTISLTVVSPPKTTLSPGPWFGEMPQMITSIPGLLLLNKNNDIVVFIVVVSGGGGIL